MTYQYKTYVLKKMNIPFTIQLVNKNFPESLVPALDNIIKDIENYLNHIEEHYSPFKETSWVNHHTDIGDELSNFFFDEEYQSIYFQTMLAKKETDGIFDPFFNGKYNPTGLVKGFAIETAFFKYLQPLLENNILVAAAINGGGDMQVGTQKDSYFSWNIGIENPLNPQILLATYKLKNGSIATSGLSKRGNHIFSQEDIYYKQMSIVGDYLSTIDIYATVGVASTEESWKNFIQKKNITGLAVTKDNMLVPFEKGEFINVKRSQILS